jgi:hypothetical protein
MVALCITPTSGPAAMTSVHVGVLLVMSLPHGREPPSARLCCAHRHARLLEVGLAEINLLELPPRDHDAVPCGGAGCFL